VGIVGMGVRVGLAVLLGLGGEGKCLSGETYYLHDGMIG
jgi:hypothetical protein